jgi:DNA repair photolyase
VAQHSDKIVRKGRGSVSNAGSRYIARQVVAVDDGWWQDEVVDTSLATQVLVDRTKRLITTNQSPDIPFDQSINAYKGCEHGCIYCFARPTHAYLDLSPGIDFETKIFKKTNVVELLRKELGKPGYECSTIAMGTNTDPYQPAEKTHGVTRAALEVLRESKHPVSIVTKSTMILRDLDILADMAEAGLVSVNVSVTTLDVELKTKLEPRTAGPRARLKTIRSLLDAGVPTGAMLAPVIPFVNDHEIEDIVGACHDAGAMSMNYILLRLPLEVGPLFEEWLSTHYPLKHERVMAAIRDTRGGRAYRARWHERMRGRGPVAELIDQRFQAALARAGLKGAELPRLRCDAFVPPTSDDRQLSLF